MISPLSTSRRRCQSPPNQAEPQSFFPPTHEQSKTADASFFPPAIQRLATPDEEKMPGTNDARMREDKMIQEKPEVQRMGGPEEDEMLQGKAENSAGLASAQVSSQIESSRGKGQPLPENTRAEMEAGIGTDFSGVRVHTDSESAALNRSLGSQAFTHGNDVYFNGGKYRPETSEGKHLLAHELIHTVQQGGGAIKRRVNYLECSGGDLTNVQNQIGMSLTQEDLKFMLSVISEISVYWINQAIGKLRQSPRGLLTRMNFHEAFAAFPEWVPGWRPSDARWTDFGELIATRLESASRILSGGWIQFYCLGSPDHCPECTRNPPTYYACSSFRGAYKICLGNGFWTDFAAGNLHSLASNLLHEALHIYFGTTVSHSGRSGNASCYQRFIAAANGIEQLPRIETRCPASPPPIGDFPVPSTDTVVA